MAAAGAVTGAGVAGVWLLSPVGVLFCVGMAFICAGAIRGLTPRERRWVAALLGTALVLRLLVLLAFSLSVDYSRQQFPILIGDEILSKKVALSLRDIYFGIPISTSEFQTVTYYWGNSAEGFMYILAYVQILFGLSPYAGHFLNIAFYFGGTALLYRTVRASYGRLPALGSLAVLMFLPTLFVWSISALKESSHALMLAAIVVAALQMVRGRTWVRRLAAVGLTAALIAMADVLRPGALLIGIATVCGAYAATIVAAKRWISLLAIALSLLILVAAGQSSRVQARGLALAQAAAGRHLGHVVSAGYSYKLLDQRLYSGGVSALSSMTMAEAARFAVRASVSFVVVPVPWQVGSRSALAYLPQQMAWYILFPLAVVGCIAGFQKDTLLTFLLLATIVLYGAGVALTSGNIGTMVRHRDLVVPMAVWFSGLGATTALNWMAVRAWRKRSDNWARLETLPRGAGL